MPEPILRLAAESLTRQAALYAAGRLDAAAAAAFEDLLSTDAAARDALCRAVRRSLAGDRQALHPDPSYRRRVRRRLRRTRALDGRRLVVYAAVAALLWGVGGVPEGRDVSVQQRPPLARAAELGVARHYAELSNPEASHLARSWQELQSQSAATVVLADSASETHPWALLNDTTHLARVHEEFLKRRSEGTRRREAPPGPVSSFRKHL